MKREIIKIDEDKCTGCGNCIPGCPEGALQLIDGKARLVSDLFCDGLGACIGTCPVDAITIEEREAEEYDEQKVMDNIIKQGENVIIAHLKHLKDHGAMEFYKIAVEYLKEKGIEVSADKANENSCHTNNSSGCPGSKIMDFSEDNEKANISEEGERKSHLTHWPVQLHLISPNAPYYKGSDLLLAADCTAFTVGDFHKDFLKGKTLAIACPKLDSGLDVYKEKITALIDSAKINTITLLIMQVPCCRGLLAITLEACKNAERKVPVKCVTVGIRGEILNEEWVNV